MDTVIVMRIRRCLLWLSSCACGSMQIRMRKADVSAGFKRRRRQQARPKAANWPYHSSQQPRGNPSSSPTPSLIPASYLDLVPASAQLTLSLQVLGAARRPATILETLCFAAGGGTSGGISVVALLLSGAAPPLPTVPPLPTTLLPPQEELLERPPPDCGPPPPPPPATAVVGAAAPASGRVCMTAVVAGTAT